MSYAVKLNVNNTIEMIEIPKDHDYKWYAKQIGCDFIEVVHPRYYPHPFVIDEEGRLKDNYVNIIASAMHGTFEHNEPIVGTAILMDEGLVDGEPDLIGFSLEKATSIVDDLKEMIEKADFERIIH